MLAHSTSTPQTPPPMLCQCRNKQTPTPFERVWLAKIGRLADQSVEWKDWDTWQTLIRLPSYPNRALILFRLELTNTTPTTSTTLCGFSKPRRLRGPPWRHETLVRPAQSRPLRRRRQVVVVVATPAVDGLSSSVVARALDAWSRKPQTRGACRRPRCHRKRQDCRRRLPTSDGRRQLLSKARALQTFGVPRRASSPCTSYSTRTDNSPKACTGLPMYHHPDRLQSTPAWTAASPTCTQGPCSVRPRRWNAGARARVRDRLRG